MLFFLNLQSEACQSAIVRIRARLAEQARLASENYNFDFEEGTPYPDESEIGTTDSRYLWERTDSEAKHSKMASSSEAAPVPSPVVMTSLSIDLNPSALPNPGLETQPLAADARRQNTGVTVAKSSEASAIPLQEPERGEDNADSTNPEASTPARRRYRRRRQGRTNVHIKRQIKKLKI